jgi:hypothetical protein
MEITNDSLPWDSEDCAVFRTFLTSRAGQRLLPKLAEQCPVLLEDGDAIKISIRSGKVLGFQDAVRNLLLLTVPTPESPKSHDNYPPVDDDAAHNDGQKLNE